MKLVGGKVVVKSCKDNQRTIPMSKVAVFIIVSPDQNRQVSSTRSIPI